MSYHFLQLYIVLYFNSEIYVLFAVVVYVLPTAAAVCDFVHSDFIGLETEFCWLLLYFHVLLLMSWSVSSNTLDFGLNGLNFLVLLVFPLLTPI